MESNPTLCPIFRNISYNKVAIVVFPFVPVTPTNTNFREGSPYQRETKRPNASAEQEENKVKLSDLTIREGLVPRVVGMGAKDAVFLLEQAGLRVSLSGVGRVVSQSIQPGQRVSKGQTVLLTLK